MNRRRKLIIALGAGVLRFRVVGAQPSAYARVLGMKNPAALLREVRSGRKLGRRDASASVSRLMKARLRAQRPD